MNNLITICFSSQAQADADAVHSFIAPLGMTLVGVSVYPEAFSGTPTGFNLDINIGETEAVKALSAGTAGTAAAWKTPHFGGSNAPIALAAGDAVTVDINLSGGATPTADYDIVLWLLAGTV